ncbi:hypothetical protein RRSWK_06175 [Rhodopirellula sp. SWK7]|nr:hypothetical protein RRSWK_06175 [Rhodopirellula sp. SWK7]
MFRRGDAAKADVQVTHSKQRVVCGALVKDAASRDRIEKEGMPELLASSGYVAIAE